MTYIKKYVKKGINIPCASCGKTFYVWPSYLKLKRGKYCSVDCFDNRVRKPKRDFKIYLKENEDSELKELAKTSLFKNHTKESVPEAQSYPIILNPVPFNWLYDLRMKEVEMRGGIYNNL